MITVRFDNDKEMHFMFVSNVQAFCNNLKAHGVKFEIVDNL